MRNMIDDKVKECYQRNPVPLPEGKDLQQILDDITILEKGITFEWFTVGDSFDFEAVTIRMVTDMVKSFFPGEEIHV